MLQLRTPSNSGLPTERMRFAKAVKDALAGMHDPVRLESSALASWFPLGQPNENNILPTLRALLRTAIECLQPERTIPYGRSEWLGYRLLWSRYVQSQSRHRICDELGLSQNTYYRIHRESLNAVIRVLWERYREASLGAASSCPQIHAPASNLKTLVNNLALRSKPQMVPLNHVLESAVRIITPFAETKRARIQIEAPPILPCLRGDPAILRQIILNILVEAVKLLSEDVLQLSVTTQKRGVVYRVGPLDASHISSENLGSFSGIRLSRSLLVEYGGSCWLCTGENNTATISFCLPVHQPPLVLIVDDDADTLELYARYLRGEEYDVVVASNAREVKRILSEMTPHAILLDVLMPLEDGWDILRYLKEAPETAAVPVVVCSVLDQPQLALAMGVAKVLVKPIKYEVLLQTLRDILPTGHIEA